MLDALPIGRALWPTDRRRALIGGIALWVIPMIVVTALVAKNPLKHTVTIDSYHFAARAWWNRESLYVGPSGMNYLPHFAILFTPFHLLPFTLCEILWRWCAALSLAFGLCRLAKILSTTQAEQAFLWMTIFAMPLSMAALRNGNANAIFGGVCLLAIVSTLEARWSSAVAWMALAIAIKPLGIVLFGLAALFYVPVLLRAPMAIVALAIFPFLFGAPNYVSSQEHDAWINLRACAAVTDNRFADLNGILRAVGASLSPEASTIIRAVAGVLTAVAWLWGARRLAGETAQNLWLYALAAAYLMVFNPMNEANSYVILAPALAVWAVWFLLQQDPPDRWRGWAIAAMALSMGLLPNLVRPWFGNHFALVWHPLMAIIFVGIVAYSIARRHAPAAVVVEAASHCA